MFTRRDFFGTVGGTAAATIKLLEPPKNDEWFRPLKVEANPSNPKMAPCIGGPLHGEMEQTWIAEICSFDGKRSYVRHDKAYNFPTMFIFQDPRPPEWHLTQVNDWVGYKVVWADCDEPVRFVEFV